MKTRMSESSLEANAINKLEGIYTGTELKIMEFLTHNSHKAHTCREIALGCDLEINAVSGRLNELKGMAKKKRKPVIEVIEKRLCTTNKGSKKVKVQAVQIIGFIPAPQLRLV